MARFGEWGRFIRASETRFVRKEDVRADLIFIFLIMLIIPLSVTSSLHLCTCVHCLFSYKVFQSLPLEPIIKSLFHL